jgi:adhesin transport system membrane fusion protein
MRQSDFAFANDVRAAVELRTPRTSRMLLMSSIAMLAAGLVWANFAVLDEVKRGNGKVVPSRQIQVVQSLEGGIVDAILVQEGSIVQQGDPLIRINDTNFSSQLGEIRERHGAMAARVLRLEAEAKDLNKLVFQDELMREAPQATAIERSVFETHARKLAQDVNVLAQQETRLEETLQLLNREVTLTRKLYEQRVVPEIEMIRLERQASELRGQLAEVQSRKITVKTTFLSQVDDDLAKSKGDLAVLDENIKSAQDKVRRTDRKSVV